MSPTETTNQAPRALPRVRGAVVLIALLAAVAAVRGCVAPSQPLRLVGTSMGTTWSVVVAGDGPFSGDEARELRRVVEEELARVDDAMSTWRPETAVSRFNAAEPGVGVELGEATWEVLDVSRRAHDATGGAFDPTVGPLVKAWGFGGGAKGEAPDADELRRLHGLVGFEHLVDRRPVLDKDVAGVEIDFSAVAKGFAVDRVSDALVAAGATNHLVEVGGEVRVRGERPGGGAWRVGVEDPSHPEGGRAAEVLALSERALATSGDYRNAREVDGELVSHLFDPRVLRPIATHVASASVVAPTCARADALATALAVLGSDGIRLLEDQGDVEAMIYLRREDGGFDREATSGFDAFVEAAGH
ncbi:MAG: FAD:protein FMN transferase [Planctomycetota bacterium]